MSIVIKNDRIEFTANGSSNTFTLQETADGFKFNGIIGCDYLLKSGFQGIVAGFTSGGYSVPTGYSNIIDKFRFVTDGNATDVGDLTQGRYLSSGQSSSTHGYTSAGRTGPPTDPGYSYVNTIDKFSFSTDGNATDVGDMASGLFRGSAGQSSSLHGYATGGFGPGLGLRADINKFSFTTDTNAIDIGDLTAAREQVIGQSSSISGYTSGGTTPAPAPQNVIDKFAFANDSNATDVGDLTQSRFSGAGQSSTTHGYVSGGSDPGRVNTIDKFPFSADSNATDVGDLSGELRSSIAGQSSITFGYSSGGTTPTASQSNTIDKFPFSANSNSTDVGDLSVARQSPAGQQF